eukprot:1804746-Pyramimonas_sp.AAC.1
MSRSCQSGGPGRSYLTSATSPGATMALTYDGALLQRQIPRSSVVHDGLGLGAPEHERGQPAAAATNKT